MFNHDRAGVARLVGWGEEHEQAVVAILPVAALAARGTGREAPDLRGAGLAAHLDALERQPARAGSAVSVHDLPHAAAHRFEMLGVEADQGRGLLADTDQPRLDVAAGCDACRHDGELKRVHNQEALADRGVECVRRGPVRPLDDPPALLILAQLPGAVGHGAVILADHRQVELLAKAKLLGDGRDAVVTDAVTHRVEIGVAALGDGTAHVDRAVAAEATEEAIAEAIAAGAVDAVRRLDPVRQQRQRAHRLDGRAGRIKRVQDLVQERLARILRKALPFGAADAVGEAVGVVRGHRHHSDDVAGQAVENDAGAGFLAHSAGGEFLKIGVDGELDGAAAAVRLGLKLADQLAARGELDALPARLPAKPLLERLLQPLLADLEARRNQQRVLLFLILLCRGRADVADQVADRRARGVEAREAAHRLYARELGKAHGDGGIINVRDVFRDLHRLIALRGLELAQDAIDLVDVELEQVGEGPEGLLRVLDLVGDEVDAKVAAIDRDRLAVPVDDPAAARGDNDQLDAIAFGQQLIMLVLRDRQPAKSPDQQRANRGLGAADERHAPREGEALVDRCETPLHLHRPSLHRSRRAMTQAAIGNAKMEMTSGGTILEPGSGAPINPAIHHSRLSLASRSSAASAHSIQ
jgi:hypothetical protein